MSRTVVCILFVVVALSTVWGNRPKKCGKNEVPTDCAPTCPPKCHPPQNLQACSAICVKGCQCKPGYLRNSRNRCVLPCNCDCPRRS